MTVVVVTHEIGFAREVADSLLFIDEGLAIERGDAREVLSPLQERPLIGTVPGRPRTFLATGFSGTGFKIASGVGSLIARRALGHSTDTCQEGTLQFADPGRFAHA